MTKGRRIVMACLLFASVFAAAQSTISAEALPTVISRHFTTDEGLPSNSVQCALKDRDGFLWFGTWYGLSRFDGTNFVNYSIPVRSPSDLPPRKVESMAEDAYGNLWLKTVDWKLYVFYRQTESFHVVYDELKPYTRNLQVIKIQPTADGHVLLLCKDKTLLLATSRQPGSVSISRLFDAHGHVHPQTFQLQHDITATAGGYTFYIGRDYRLFITRQCSSMQMAAAMAEDADSHQRRTLRLQAMALSAGISKYAQLYEDRDSLLWVATPSDGVYCVSQPPHLFRLIQLPDNDVTGVRSIFQLHDGTILVSTRSRNVYLFQPDGTLSRTLDYAHYAIGAVYHAAEDRQGRLWLSTKGDGLVIVDLSPTGRGWQGAVHYRHVPDDPTSLSGDDVYMTFTDSQRHIWVCTLDGGVNLVRENADGTLSFYNKHHGFKHYPAYGLYNEARSITEDANGRLWIGTIEGLMSLDSRFTEPQQADFKTYHDTPSATFAENDIYTLYRDRQRQIWVGAFGGGLGRLVHDGQSDQPTFRPLGTREGLRSDVILSAVEDQQGYLWFATEAGLSYYNQQTQRIRNFGRYDGLPAVEMEETVALCCANGQLWIGCKQGILAFHPRQLHTSAANYRTVITRLVSNRHPYIGPTALPYADTVRLTHRQNAFTIEFAALNYRSHDHVSYRYRLEGFDRDWRYSGVHPVGSYNEVPPGHYRFVVETIDDASPSLHSAATLAIHILPPWWATWWAYLLYFCAFALIVWLVAHTILQMNRMRNEIYISQRLAKLTSKPDDGDVFIDRLHRIIRQNISNGDFNIDAIAAEMGLSRSAFYKKVKGQTGFAPIDLIKEFRLSHAAQLLQTTTLSITEVAYRSGFKDASYFGKCFRKRYGQSPREFVQNLLGKKE